MRFKPWHLYLSGVVSGVLLVSLIWLLARKPEPAPAPDYSEQLEQAIRDNNAEHEIEIREWKDRALKSEYRADSILSQPPKIKIIYHEKYNQVDRLDSAGTTAKLDSLFRTDNVN